MPLPNPRGTTALQISRRPIEFVFWPVAPSGRRFGAQLSLFANSPWAAMKGGAFRAAVKAEAFSYLEQAEDFYRAAMSSRVAHPTLLYYCFMNVAKAIILARTGGTLASAFHGLTVPGGTENVQIHPPPGGRVSVFRDAFQSLGYIVPPDGSQFDLTTSLLPAIATGHRVWAAGARVKERVLRVEDVSIMDDRTAHRLWVNVWLRPEHIRSRWSVADIRTRGGLANFMQVNSFGSREGLICLQQAVPVNYVAQPGRQIEAATLPLRSVLWRRLSAIEPYRRHYVYITPVGTSRPVPQVIGLYMTFFALGFLIRYRPTDFNALLRGPYESTITEFLASQPEQLVYMLASELLSREVVPHG